MGNYFLVTVSFDLIKFTLIILQKFHKTVNPTCFEDVPFMNERYLSSRKLSNCLKNIHGFNRENNIVYWPMNSVNFSKIDITGKCDIRIR